MISDLDRALADVRDAVNALKPHLNQKAGRIPFLAQSHHLLSLFRQMTDDERREQLVLLIGIAGARQRLAEHGSIELVSATRVMEMSSVALRSSVPLDVWQLAHIAIDWGHIDLSADLKEQFNRDLTAPARAGRRKVGDPLREAARQDIKENPKTTQGACARRVAAALGRDDVPNIERRIRDLFEWSQVGDGRRQKRPRPTAE